MNPSILLLDCSRKLEEKLKRQGFDVASGNIGRTFSGKSCLPGPIYEYEIIIYNPSIIAHSPLEDLLDTVNKYDASLRLHRVKQFAQQTRSDFAALSDHLARGAIVLLFINHVSPDLTFLNASYSWVPNMPQIETSGDYKPLTLLPELATLRETAQTLAESISELLPLLNLDDLKRPVAYKLKLNEAFSMALPLFLNRQQDYLACH